VHSQFTHLFIIAKTAQCKADGHLERDQASIVPPPMDKTL